MFEIETLTGANCHQQFLARVKVVAEAVGWVTQRTSATEWIGKSTGLSGTEEIYIGVQTYESVPLDYYNVCVGAFSGYVAANSFATQPGARISGVPAHNTSLKYYLAVNLQRVVFGLKVGPPVYEHGYVGKFFPYSTPSNYPYPMICGGMLDGVAATRYSNTDLQMPYVGIRTGGATYCQLYNRKPDGTWDRPSALPWFGSYSTSGSTANMVPVESSSPYSYRLEPIVLLDNKTASPFNVWGELDGVFAVSGFGAVAENILQEGGSSVVNQAGLSMTEVVDEIHAVSGKAYVMLPNHNRNGFPNFVALEMI